MFQFPEHRSLASTEVAKKKITKTILQMSLEHHIVTPFTAMVIENDAGDERMLADSPPQDRSCCGGQCFLSKKRKKREREKRGKGGGEGKERERERKAQRQRWLLCWFNFQMATKSGNRQFSARSWKLQGDALHG